MDNGASSYRRYLDGDESAFEELEKLYFARLVFFIKGFVGDEFAAEDIAVDTFVELVVHPARYNFKNSFSTYLFAIARHKALNYIKRSKKINFVPLDGVSYAADGAEVSDALETDERNKALRLAMGTLPKDLYSALCLTYFEELSFDDAAKIMKKSTKQVYNLVYRAKAELRKVLGEEELI